VYPKIILLCCGLCIRVFAFAQGEAPPVFKVKAIEINVESLKTKFHHSLIQKNTLGVFSAFDNIQIDGYLQYTDRRIPERFHEQEYYYRLS